MSDHSLPDEIISEILSPALKVSDEVFRDTSAVSPFSNYSESTSAYLLVCKSWLRVATPLLYNVVILRSKAQAKALSLALSGNEELGQFIKKLRVEGGYGAPMLAILKHSPNISDLFVSLEIYSTDNTNGLCKGLELINPTTLILRERRGKLVENKMVSQLLDALSKSIPKWDRLRAFDSPWTLTSESNRFEPVFSPLAKSKRLHTVAISTVSSAAWAYHMFKQCPLETIHVKTPLLPSERNRWDLRLEKDPELRRLLKFVDWPNASSPEPIPELPLVTNPFFIPLAGAPQDVRDQIWARVLYFAMSVPELAYNPTMGGVPPKLPLLLVSKTFYRLGLPSMCAHVFLQRSSAVPSFASALSRNPSIGPYVRSLAVEYLQFLGDDSDSDVDDEQSKVEVEVDESVGADPMLAVLSRTGALVRFGRNKNIPIGRFSFNVERSISWDAFETMARLSGSSLRDCAARIDTRELASASVFAGLTALRALDWNSSTTFADVPNASSDGLPNLEELRISSASPSFMLVMSRMKLPYLRRVVISGGPESAETLLRSHGSKLTELYVSHATIRTKILEFCPNLRTLSISGYGRPEAVSFSLPEPVTSLVEIVFEASQSRKDSHMSKMEIAEWERFFTEFDPVSFPNLREMKVEYCEWPTTEREIAKSSWARWGEMMMKRNINLVNRNGTKWRPRLKVK
ncbi:hypothetical protein B0H14DRAFT_2678766 [Mycena olivaceomarginata]|nr:hypothetical protein B0H14DRAFT_2678766 [Mycena olivaceomarginata]